MSLFKRHYNHKSSEKYIKLMAYLMQDMQVETNGKLVGVPLYYTGGERRVEGRDVLPRAGMKLVTVEPDPNRTFNRYHNHHGSMNQRVACDFIVTYSARAKRHQEVYQILEQILGAFTPSIEVNVIDNDYLDNNQNIDIHLDSWIMDDDWLGEGEEPSYYDLEVTFRMKGYVYRAAPSGGEGNIIKQIIVQQMELPDDAVNNVTDWIIVGELEDGHE